MEQKHTPGPWYADPYEDDCDGIGVCAKGKGIVADVDSDYCEPEEMRANAHLIAAAPEMKEALQWVESAFRDYSLDHGARNAMVRVKAALAKAEGR